MYRIVWEYVAREPTVEEFRAVYGPEGPWCHLFGGSDGYLGTELFRSDLNGCHFVTLDTWRSRMAYEQFRKTRAEEFAELDRWCRRLIDKERTLGVTDDGRD